MIRAPRSDSHRPLLDGLQAQRFHIWGFDCFQPSRRTAIRLDWSFCGSYMDRENLAKRIRDACLEAVLQAYEDAGVQGLCAEGRWEAAIGALRTLDLAPLLREFQRHSAD